MNSISSLQYPKDSLSRAFAAQYTAMILIILTFVLGAFSQEPKTSVISENKNQHEEVHARPDIGTLIGSELLENGHLNTDLLFAVTEVLKNHDVDAIITLPLTSNITDSFNISREISQIFLNENVPKSAFIIEFVKDFGTPKIKFKRAEDVT